MPDSHEQPAATRCGDRTTLRTSARFRGQRKIWTGRSHIMQRTTQGTGRAAQLRTAAQAPRRTLPRFETRSATTLNADALQSSHESRTTLTPAARILAIAKCEKGRAGARANARNRTSRQHGPRSSTAANQATKASDEDAAANNRAMKHSTRNCRHHGEDQCLMPPDDQHDRRPGEDSRRAKGCWPAVLHGLR